MAAASGRIQIRKGEDGNWEALLPNAAVPIRVLAWQPPRLLLERAGEVQSFFLVRGKGGFFLGRDGKSWFFPDTAEEEVKRGSMRSVEALSSPMPGKIVQITVAVGDTVTAGQRLLIVEAMKMENPIKAPHAGKVRKICVQVDEMIQAGRMLIEILPLEESSP